MSTKLLTLYAKDLLPGDVIFNAFSQPLRRVERVEAARRRGYVVITGPALVRVEYGSEGRTSCLARTVLQVQRS